MHDHDFAVKIVQLQKEALRCDARAAKLQAKAVNLREQVLKMGEELKKRKEARDVKVHG